MKTNYPEEIKRCKSWANWSMESFQRHVNTFNQYSLIVGSWIVVITLFAPEVLWFNLFFIPLLISCLRCARKAKEKAFYFRQEWLNMAKEWEKLWELQKKGEL